MKKIYLSIVVVLLVMAGAWYLTKSGARSDVGYKEVSTVEKIYSVFSNNKYGFEFDYRTELLTGYIIEEEIPEENNDKNYLHGFYFIRMQDITNIWDWPEGAPGPSAIGVFVYKNIKNQTPGEWMEENILPNVPDTTEMGNILEAELAGKEAVSFMAYDIFSSENVITTHGDYIFYFLGQFVKEDSQVRSDYLNILNSVRFLEDETKN